ncbi:MAG: iron ABC transporter permease [Chloroflexi bacterium]|nr:iron ABC transporter permease [Chloroflexota bacterium]
MTALLLAVGFFTVFPLAMLFHSSFKTAGNVGLGSYLDIITAAGTLKTLWTTVWLAAVRAALATALAVGLAWVVTRTNTPYKGVIEFLAWLAFFIPVLPRTVAWMVLAMPKSGLLNVWLTQAFHLESPIFNIQSYAGIIWVSVLSYSTVLFLLITPAFRAMDSSLEEASRTSGAGSLTTLTRVTVPLLTPAILAAAMLAFVRMMESFEIELLLGYPARIFVFTTRIYDYLDTSPAQYDFATTLSTVFVLITFFLMFYQWRILRRRERYTTVTGRGFAVRSIDLGRFKYVTAGVAFFFLGMATFVPLAGLIAGSFMKVPGLVNLPEPFTVSHYQEVFSNQYLWPSIKNTLVLAFSAATLGIILYAVTSWVVVRSSFWGRPMLEFFSWLPYAVPALVLGLGFLWAFVGGVRLPFAAYGTMPLLVLAFLVRGMPLGVRVMNGAMIQLGQELEDSSRVHGASWFATFRRIVLPLLRPALLSSWILLFVIIFMDLATVILLYSPGTRVLSVLLFEYWSVGRLGATVVLGAITSAIVVGTVLAVRLLWGRSVLGGSGEGGMG